MATQITRVIASISRPHNDDVTPDHYFNDILPGIPKVQWQHFLDWLGHSSTSDSRNHLNGSTSCWLIDSGASHHVTGNFDLLSNIHNVTNCPIGLPDGKQVVSTMKGDVKLCSDIVLRNVFYVPDLQCNLISVTQLTDDMSCVLLFTKTFCVIQDLQLRTLIGVGERRDGLYYFRDFPRIGAMNIDGVSSFDLWHQRLSHPSY
ncbi:unnamed protein product [Amaranthus hypochondriacus]